MQSNARFMMDQSGKPVRVIQNSVNYLNKPYDSSCIINNQQDQYARPIKPISIQRYG